MLNERDQKAYQTFLEVQLERVTQACTQATAGSDKFEKLEKVLFQHDEKINNVGRLVKLQ